jgi:hypothetical protein
MATNMIPPNRETMTFDEWKKGRDHAVDAGHISSGEASIANAIKNAGNAVTIELESIDHRLGQVLVGLDQLKRIVDRLDMLLHRTEPPEG